MNAFSCCVCLAMLVIHLWHPENAFADNSSYVPSDNIALNCGSNSSHLIQFDGRNWTGDQYESSYNYPHTNSLIAQVPLDVESIPKVPYMTARIFLSQFTYKFNVSPGPKFIRLHFYPASYSGLNISEAFLSVSCGEFTLLHNFSASLATEHFNSTYHVKEFIIHASGPTLELMFSPTSNDSGAYAFVNGIEVVSMPPNLYIRGDHAPIPLVGHDSKVLYIHNNSALETLYRVNVGGNEIPPRYDTGMFRTWDTDDYYFFGAPGVIPFDMNMSVIYPADVPSYTAPENVYRTARSMAPFEAPLINLNYNMTWLFAVDSGFNYLVRLHFCEVDPAITRINERVFTICLNNQTAEEGADVIAFGGGRGVAVYKDFVVMIPETKEGEQDLWLDLHPYTKAKPLYYNAILNGVEVFKMSTEDGNLAGLNPLNSKSRSTVHQVTDKKPKRNTVIIIPSVLGAVTLSLVLISCVIVMRFQMIRGGGTSRCGLFVPSTNQKSKRANHPSFCHRFSMEKIRLGTNDFDEALVIGTGGFGKVYKGSFDGGATFVAIKRCNPMSEQGALEFETEIRMLSELRHNNLVSLLGYCQEDGEMILVYDFMSGGALHDLLHSRQQSSQGPPLSWIQRLEICIGVAQGLHYLHTGTERRIIHRDIKTSNILLDHNFVAKISDFGLSKASYPTLSSTNVKGSVGYLDPEYYRRQNLTEKSDVYSFGVVLMEVLSSKPAVAAVEDERQHSNLADWAFLCCERGLVDQLVDPSLHGKIAAESLENYLGVAKKCLAGKAVDRPPMGDVLQGLVLALQLEKNAEMGEGNVHIEENSDLTPGIEFSDIINPIGR